MPNIGLGRHARRWISVGVIVVVAGSGGATAWAMTGPSGPAYRTATVTRADVTQTLLSTGTIEPVSEANVSFPVSGQVSSVSVGLGSHVAAGQVLARLSTSALTSDVSAAESAVATANERLAADEASETTTTAYLTTTDSVATTAYVSVDPGGGTGSGGSGSTGGAGGGSGGSGGTGGSGGSGGSGSSGSSGSTSPVAGELRAIAREQGVVIAAQHRLDGQLAEAKSLLSVEGNLCTATSTPTPPPTGNPNPTPTPTGSASPTPTPTPTVSAELPGAHPDPHHPALDRDPDSDRDPESVGDPEFLRHPERVGRPEFLGRPDHRRHRDGVHIDAADRRAVPDDLPSGDRRRDVRADQHRQHRAVPGQLRSRPR